MANEMRNETTRVIFPERRLIGNGERDLDTVERHDGLCGHESLSYSCQTCLARHHVTIILTPISSVPKGCPSISGIGSSA